MDGVGGNLNAFTDKESTCYYAKVIDHHIPLAIDVLSDMFLNSVFEPSELAKEQKVVLEEIRMYDDSPDDLIHDLFTRTMWRDSNLGEPTIGYAETVSALTRDDLTAHLHARYAPQTVVFAAAGNLEHDRIVELCAAAFADFGGAGDPPPAERPPLTPGSLVQRKDTEQAYVVARDAGALGPRRAALCAIGARYDPRRRDVEPALSGGPREARTGDTACIRFNKAIAPPASSAFRRGRRPRAFRSASTSS